MLSRTSFLHACHDRDPENAQLACHLADELIMQSAYAAALSLLRDLPVPSWDLPEVQARIARCALATGSYDIAIEQLKVLLAQGKRDQCAEHDLAYALLCAKRPLEAMSLVTAAAELFGEDKHLLILRARIHMASGQYLEAQDAARAASLLDKEDATALGIQALALLDGGCDTDAGEMAKTALDLDPQQYEAMLVRSTLLLWARNGAAAGELFDRILIRNPNCARTLYGCGQLAMIAGDCKRAENYFLHSTQITPEHIGAWHALAWTQLLQGDTRAARLSFESAHDLDRSFSDTQAGLAIVSMLEGEMNRAGRLVALATRLDPTSITASCASGLFLHLSGDSVAANAKFQELLGVLKSPSNLAPHEFVIRFMRMLRPNEQDLRIE